MAVNTLDAQAARVRPRWMSRTGALTSVVGAAVVAFVVSLSVALGLQFTPDSGSEHPQIANAADEPAPAATPPSVARAAPQPPPPAAPPPPPPPRHHHRKPCRRSRRRFPWLRLRFPKSPRRSRYSSPPLLHRLRRRPCTSRSPPPPVYQPIAPPPAAPPPAPAYVPARARLCPARTGAAAGDLPEAAPSRSDHRTHPDHQTIPRA